MNLRPLGKTTLQVSPLSLGTMTFGAQADEAASRSMLDLSLERGINFIDTANAYNAGKTEEILGRALKGRRDRVILASKVFNKMGDGPNDRGLSRPAILKAIDETLKRLQTDFLDLYYFHQPDYAVPLEESLQAMDELIRSGKVRFVGASNYASWQVAAMLWLAEKNNWQSVTVVQPMYNLLARGIEQELLPMCKNFGLAVVPYNPLAGGLLTGKHPTSAPIPDTRFERMPIYKDRYWHQANFDAVQQLTKIAKAAGRSLTRLAIGWLLHNPANTSVILGASKLEHLQDNLAALDDPPLSSETLAACDAVWKTLRGVTPQYNR
jgi:1-deoxyxylulose-5-phosphate synthase